MKTEFGYSARWFAAGCAALLAASCSKQQPAPADVVRPVVSMTVQPAQARQRSFSAVTRSEKNIELSFRVGGQIVELPVKMGMAVKTGDPIAKLDTSDYDLQVKQAEAQLAQAEAQWRQADSELARVRRQYEANVASKSDLDNALAAHNTTAAARDAARKNKELAEQQSAHCVLSSPVDGAVASVPVELHKTVSAGEPVAVLSGGEAIDVELGVPDILIGDVKTGMGADLVFKAFPGETFKATVVEVGITADSQTRTYPVRLRLDAKDRLVRPGMTCEAVFMFARGGAGIVAPPAAVVPMPTGERYVWVYSPEKGVVERREVKIGGLTSDGLEILEGLAQGEVIVTRGVHQLTEGMKVRLLEQP